MDRYKIAGILGDGSFGTVFDGTHIATGARVAIKRLKQAFDSWASCTRLREVASLTKLRHEHIIRLLEVVFSKDDGSLCFVFEYVESNVFRVLTAARHWREAALGGGGPPLPFSGIDAGGSDTPPPCSLETGSGLSEACIRRIMGQLLSGLSFMHRHGFFHRDLKPENLLCRSDGSGLKVADFGQARNTRSRPPYTPYVGTRWYRSPEGALGLPTYNSPVDVWGAGAIFAELYAGHPVFPGATGAAQVFSIAALLGPLTPSTWPEGARQCAAGGIRMDVGVIGGAGSGGASLRERLEGVCTGASAAALDAMCAMLQWDPARRPSAADVLAGPFFAGGEGSDEWGAPFGSVEAAVGLLGASPLPDDTGADDALPTSPHARAGAQGGGRAASRSPAPPTRRAPPAVVAPAAVSGVSAPDLPSTPADHAALSADIDADLAALGLPSAAVPLPRGGAGSGKRRSSLTVTAGGIPLSAAPGSLAEAFAVRQAVVALRRSSTSAGGAGDAAGGGLDKSIEDLLSEVESGGGGGQPAVAQTRR